MRWSSKYTHVDYQHGSTRLKRVFAFLPTNINGQIVWLETYEVLQFYQITPYTAILEGETVTFTKGQWVDISTRLMNDKPPVK